MYGGLNQSSADGVAGDVLGYSDRTVREWRLSLTEQGFPDSYQGKYERVLLWSDEELNQKATEFIRTNGKAKGKPNLTTLTFCEWVNSDLLPSSSLEPHYPRKVGVETCRRWMHELGFEIVDGRKGIYIDGHERKDVVESRQKFLRKMIALGFITKEEAPSEKSKLGFPEDIESPPLETISNTVFIFHDESTFNANEDQGKFWGDSSSNFIKPKSRGSGINVSDFIEEHGGFLKLTMEEYD